MATIEIKRNPNYREIPFGGEDGYVITKIGGPESDQYAWMKSTAKMNYNDVDFKPEINGITLVGDRSWAELGLDIIAPEIVRSRYEALKAGEK